MMRDQREVWGTFCLNFQSCSVIWLAGGGCGGWRVDTVNRGTEVKCYQFIWSLSERCCSRGRWDHQERKSRVTKFVPDDKKTQDNLNTNNICTWTDSSPENAVKPQLLMVTKSLTVLRNLPALLNTSFFKHQTTLWSFGSGRQEFEVLRVHGHVHSSSKTDLMSVWTETICLRSQLWTQPVTKWVF